MLEKFGFYVFPWGKQRPATDRIVDLARFGEQLGYDSVHLPYHLTLPTNWVFADFGNRDMLDPLVVLPSIIQGTNTIKVSLNTAVLPLLHPYVWAKFYSTCDRLSNGRLIAGVAIGWWQEEFDIAGAQVRQRGRMTDEALETMVRLWTEDSVTHNGQFYQFTDISLEPKPKQEPYPPVLVGGGMASAERAAKYGKYLMPLNPSPSEVRDVMKPRMSELAAQYGNEDLQLAIMNYVAVSNDAEWIKQQYSNMQRCAGGTTGKPVDPKEVALYGSPEECAERTQALLDAGVDYIILDCQYHGLENEGFAKEQLQRFAEDVVPLLQ